MSRTKKGDLLTGIERVISNINTKDKDSFETQGGKEI